MTSSPDQFKVGSATRVVVPDTTRVAVYPLALPSDWSLAEATWVDRLGAVV